MYVYTFSNESVSVCMCTGVLYIRTCVVVYVDFTW